MCDKPKEVWLYYEVETDHAEWSEYPDPDGFEESKPIGRYIPAATIKALTARAEAAEAREQGLRNTTDELRKLRGQYSLVVGDNIRLRGEVDSLKDRLAAIAKATPQTAQAKTQEERQ